MFRGHLTLLEIGNKLIVDWVFLKMLLVVLDQL